MVILDLLVGLLYISTATPCIYLGNNPGDCCLCAPEKRENSFYLFP